MSEEEKIITEEDLDGLLEETKGDSTETVVEVETEKEEVNDGRIELELETEEQEKVETGKEEEGIELEVEQNKQIMEDEGIELGEKEIERRNFAEVMHPELRVEQKKAQQLIHAIQPIIPQTGLVAPVCSVQESVRIFKEFEKAKREILTENDILWIGSDGRPTIEGEGKPHIMRSGWRKLARFFGLSWDIENIEKLTMEHGGYMYKVRVKVWHPAGASVISEGVSTSKDAFFTKGGRKEASEENVLMKAQTVAVNRAISDILGSGEVSGEEEE